MATDIFTRGIKSIKIDIIDKDNITQFRTKNRALGGGFIDRMPMMDSAAPTANAI